MFMSEFPTIGRLMASGKSIDTECLRFSSVHALEDVATRASILGKVTFRTFLNLKGPPDGRLLTRDRISQSIACDLQQHQRNDDAKAGLSTIA